MTYLRDEHNHQLTQKFKPSRVWAGKVATNATAFDDRVSVTVPGMDGGHLRWEDVRWQPRNNNQLPKRGDTCVIVLDDHGEMWIPVWWPKTLLTGGDADWLTGIGTPNASTGQTGDFYIDTDDDIIYGPKQGSAPYWPVALNAGDTGLPARLQEIGPLITNFNTPKASGWYRPNVGSANGPPGTSEYGMLFHNEWDGGNGHATQLFHPMYEDALYMRNCITYAWQAWKKVSPIDNVNLPVRLSSNSSVVTDCNAVQQSGWYRLEGAATNYPSGNNGWGRLWVGSWDGTNYASQIYFSFEGTSVWMRASTGPGAWAAWTKIFPIDDTNLPGRLKGSLSLLAPSNDANQAIENGWYHLSPGSANNPMSGNWTRLQVNNMNSTSDLTQIQTSYVSDDVWMRRRQDAIWRTWVQIWPITAANLPAIPASAITINDTNLPARLRTGESNNYVANADSAAQSGWWHANSSTANMPYATDWYIEAISYDGAANYVKQMAFAFYSTDVYQRWKQQSGGFSAWQKIAPIDSSMLSGVVADASFPSRLKATGIYQGDLNNANEAGWWNFSPSTSNRPADTYGMVQTYILDGNWAWQIAYRYDSNMIWQRRRHSTTWQGWTQVWPLGAMQVPGMSCINGANAFYTNWDGRLHLRIDGSEIVSFTQGDGIWNAWPPALYASATSPTGWTSQGRYTRIANTIHFNAVISATGSWDQGSGEYYFTLPVTPSTPWGYMRIGGGSVYNGNHVPCILVRNSSYVTLTFSMGATDMSYRNVGAGNPYNWGTNVSFDLYGTYEVS